MSENRGNKRILLVDDSETVLMLERMILKGGSYELAMAKDAEEGIAKALALRPDLILMDVIMPKMNGFDAIRELRRQPETRSIPILIVTTRGKKKAWKPAI